MGVPDPSFPLQLRKPIAADVWPYLSADNPYLGVLVYSIRHALSSITTIFSRELTLFRRGDPHILYTGWQIQKSSTIEEDFLQGGGQWARHNIFSPITERGD